MRCSLLNKFQTLQPKLFSFKFGCIWPSGSWEKDFYKCSFDCYKFSHVFLLFPFVTIHLNNIVTASPETALCHVWLYGVKWFWKKYEKNENFAERRTGVQKSASELKIFSFQCNVTVWSRRLNTRSPFPETLLPERISFLIIK